MLSLLIQTSGFEATMLDNDKLMVVLAVVLIIWLGIVIFIYATDRKINQIESSIQHLLENEKPAE
ncbi:MAG: hypothetical protein F4065_02665 [Rhodothermaceae bacterium]|nr:hypothetical protein [Rhodothermaceae bacterium]MXZ58311.1 hypothetical protein [Rhodothermaceae bacterium]MYB92071.1 hypothetical protein [Rhodothermaceae bacterium]MYD67917.1 hypothetical protein [Rhodothermaceae bacterium]MYG44115.1 hypothetical protein [Rhodothermaceae bacterium]